MRRKINNQRSSFGRKMTTIMCFGTFDLLHLGHLHYFQQAKKYGDYLIVVVARDATKERQQKETIFNERERLQLVGSLKIVDEAVLGNPEDHYTIIIEKKPDAICLGYDHPVTEEALEEELQKRNLNIPIRRMKPYHPKRQKSSRLREKLLSK